MRFKDTLVSNLDLVLPLRWADGTGNKPYKKELLYRKKFS